MAKSAYCFLLVIPIRRPKEAAAGGPCHSHSEDLSRVEMPYPFPAYEKEPSCDCHLVQAICGEYGVITPSAKSSALCVLTVFVILHSWNFPVASGMCIVSLYFLLVPWENKHTAVRGRAWTSCPRRPCTDLQEACSRIYWRFCCRFEEIVSLTSTVMGPVF